MKKKVAAAVFGCILVFAGLFIFRPPVILVNDQYFTDLYGKERLRFAQVKASIALLRPCLILDLADSIGPSGVAFAVSELRRKPHSVVFPYRYLDGAKQYAQSNPAVMSIVFLSNEDTKPDTQEGLFYVSINRNNDLYRAGLTAVILSGGEEGRVICYGGSSLSEDGRDAFKRGLIDRGHIREPLYIAPTSDYTFTEKIISVVVSEPTERYFQKNLDYPVILFSWMNKTFTGSYVQVVFNDAPPALMADAVKAARAGSLTGGFLLLSSKIEVFYNRINDKMIKKALKTVA